jgi:hypothetical protein
MKKKAFSKIAKGLEMSGSPYWIGIEFFWELREL